MRCPGCAGELRPDCMPGGVHVWLCYGCMSWWEVNRTSGDLEKAGDLVRAGTAARPPLKCAVCVRTVAEERAWVECPGCVAEEEEEDGGGGGPLRREDCLSWRVCVNQELGEVDCRGCDRYEPWRLRP